MAARTITGFSFSCDPADYDAGVIFPISVVATITWQTDSDPSAQLRPFTVSGQVPNASVTMGTVLTQIRNTAIAFLEESGAHTVSDGTTD